MRIDQQYTAPKRQQGVSIIEVLVSMVILSIVALATCNNTIKGFVFFKRVARQSYASQLALDRLETLAARDPSTLTSADSSTESQLNYRNVQFERTTTVTVNADNSRTVSVVVSSAALGGHASFATTFSARGSS
jgi:prepilin-type N-terminal cleavage/methylation domain-containing protein